MVVDERVLHYTKTELWKTAQTFLRIFRSNAMRNAMCNLLRCDRWSTRWSAHNPEAAFKFHWFLNQLNLFANIWDVEVARKYKIFCQVFSRIAVKWNPVTAVLRPKVQKSFCYEFFNILWTCITRQQDTVHGAPARSAENRSLWRLFHEYFKI